MYAPSNYTLHFLTFPTQLKLSQFSRHPIFEGVASKDPSGLIFFRWFSAPPHAIRAFAMHFKHHAPSRRPACNCHTGGRNRRTSSYSQNMATL